MGPKKTEITNVIPGRSGQEQNLLNLLEQLAASGAGQLGDLTELAQGLLGGPTASDVNLVGQSIGRAGDLTRLQLERQSQIGQAQLGEQLGGLGIKGSSSESVQRAIGGTNLTNQIGQSLLQQQQAGGQALLNLPFQRAGVQLSANQQLFQQIIGAANPALATSLQERLAQGTQTTTTSGFSPQDFAALASGFAPIVKEFGRKNGQQSSGASGGFDPSTFISPFGTGGFGG